ncbi:hypothetical protein H7E67_18190 [Clostridium gasigenes]|uniref:hypothetical protein n=1 Tax=Clostridium gasigenes TaxID=94869 RepID=UPI00162605FF|nr:hypothetical protein [Clostridium gasigenes]MBB6625347.1 hypothetical protein [Clostridium gasigenes]MBU3089983.1 hypothetical protein [Clostridium gasigenes]MBU3107001.1 hypothetical protein [Clostridium gasigenes]
MKVKIVCDRDYETKEVELPMNEEALLKIQGSVLDRDTVGYITGAEVKYYDEQGNKIENIFLLNKQLQK